MKSLKLGDKVMVISGNHKGKEAKIVGIDRESGNAMLEGIKVVERHIRKSYLNPTGGKKTVHLGIDLSNLKLVEASKVEKRSVKKTKAKKGAK